MTYFTCRCSVSTWQHVLQAVSRLDTNCHTWWRISQACCCISSVYSAFAIHHACCTYTNSANVMLMHCRHQPVWLLFFLSTSICIPSPQPVPAGQSALLPRVWPNPGTSFAFWSSLFFCSSSPTFRAALFLSCCCCIFFSLASHLSNFNFQCCLWIGLLWLWWVLTRRRNSQKAVNAFKGVIVRHICIKSYHAHVCISQLWHESSCTCVYHNCGMSHHARLYAHKTAGIAYACILQGLASLLLLSQHHHPLLSARASALETQPLLLLLLPSLHHLLGALGLPHLGPLLPRGAFPRPQLQVTSTATHISGETELVYVVHAL